MSAMTNYMETKMLNAMRGTAAAAPASIWVGMFLSGPGESGTGGTEVSYEGYVRQQLQLTAPTASGNTVSCANSEALVFPTPARKQRHRNPCGGFRCADRRKYAVLYRAEQQHRTDL